MSRGSTANVSWDKFKAFVDERGLSIQYIELNKDYWLKAFDGFFSLECYVDNIDSPEEGSDQKDFEDNYKDDANAPLEDVDNEGRKKFRLVYAKKGWVYLANVIEFKTATEGSCISNDWQNNARPDYTFQFFDASDVEITDKGAYATLQDRLDAECVQTRVTLKPDYDYEIISGNVHQISKPNDDVRMWVIAGAVDLAEVDSSTVKEMVGGLNFRYMGANEQIETDGRASKMMKKDNAALPPGIQANGLRFIIRHTAGFKHNLMIILEYFRK